ncbi:MAG: uroporphyrinogen-III synthase [Proteobacteria bacterium]|nr:uroporphyrinogen-III synthase [Pseudomonadota bacterium]
MSSPRVAITRALPDAERTAEALRARGAEPIVAPLLEIAPYAFDTDLGGVQALLFTSANGVRAAAQALQERALPLLAVGDATANAARDAGFRDVRSANGDVRALSELAASSLEARKGALLYLSGADVAADLANLLQAAGFRTARRIVYEARVVSALPAAYTQPLDIIVFHSARAAHAFVGFGAPNAQQLTAACLSQAVADAAAQSASWARIVVATTPQEEALWRATFSGQNSPAGASA